MFLPQLASIFLLRFLSGEKHHNSRTKKKQHTQNKNTKVKIIFAAWKNPEQFLKK